MALTKLNLSNKMINFCQFKSQGDLNLTECAKKAGYGNPSKSGHRLMKMVKIQNAIKIFTEMQNLKVITLSEDLSALKGKISRIWVTQKLVVMILNPKTTSSDKIKALNLISQLKGYLSESAPAQLTPIILSYEGKQLGSLAGQSMVPHEN